MWIKLLQQQRLINICSFYEALNYISVNAIQGSWGWGGGGWGSGRFEVMKNAVKSGSIVIRLVIGLAGGKYVY